MAYMTLNEIIGDCTQAELMKIPPGTRPSPKVLESDLVNAVGDVCQMDNQLRPRDRKLTAPDRLVPAQIAAIMSKFYRIVMIQSGNPEAEADPDLDTEHDLLALYRDEGANEGIYVTAESTFKKIAEEYNPMISSHDLEEVMKKLRRSAPRVKQCAERDLIAVNNGIYNYKTKTLLPFSPEYVFLSKSRVNYNPNAMNVLIHNDEDGTDWDVESWIAELSDDPQVIELIWELLSAIIRPHVSWDKMACLVSVRGNNGKGTLCALMRNLCGAASCASIKLSEFGRDFALEQLINKLAIIVDENDVGIFIDKAAELKSVITNDVISISRKFKTAVNYQFFGLMVQCLNELPRIKDRSDAFLRRLLLIPFDKCFTGAERKYIKKNYINRPDVLEYVLYRVLNTNFYALSNPAVCERMLDEYKEYNDPVRQFLKEMLPQLKWDLVPFGFLYDLFKSYCCKRNPQGKIESQVNFTTDVLNMLRDFPGWYCKGRYTTVRSGKKMAATEPLIIEYHLVEWYSKTYMGSDPDQIAKLEPKRLEKMYRGLVRIGVQADDD